MTPQATLALAATHLDDAIEYLTFERPDWSLEELWFGIARLLDALGDGTCPTGTLSKGALPQPGTLSTTLKRTAAPASLCRLVTSIEATRARLGADGLPLSALSIGEMEPLCFEASDILAHCARVSGLIDPGAVYGALTGPREPFATRIRPLPTHPRTSAMGRRTALKLLGASTLATLAACSRPGAIAPGAAAQESAGDESVATQPPAGVREVSSIDAMQWRTSDPFLFCAYHVDDYPAGNDRMGPADSLAGRSLGRDFDPDVDWRMYHGRVIPGVPRHPHRGFETVTVVRTGLLDHADSMGATARYGGGDVQWLTAGGGIQHAEMFPLLRSDGGNPLELFQIWLNLPARDKMVDPHFTMLWTEQIPRVIETDDSGRATELTICAGARAGHRAPAPPPNSWASNPESDLAIWTLRMEPGARFELPGVGEGTERSIYLHRGEGALVAGHEVANLHRVEVEGPGPVAIEAGAVEVEILLLQARPIGEPVARRGPFVMTTQNEIQQAYSDYRDTGFGGWPWPDDAPVHDRTKGRFALRPDGELEEPT